MLGRGGSEVGEGSVGKEWMEDSGGREDTWGEWEIGEVAGKGWLGGRGRECWEGVD